METNEPQVPSFDSLAERFAFDWKHERKDFREALALMPETGKFPREYLQAAADELMALGITGLARRVAEVAARCPSMTDLRYCDYVHNPIDTQNNVKMWLWGEERRAKRIRERGKELLRRAGIDEDWQTKL